MRSAPQSALLGTVGRIIHPTNDGTKRSMKNLLVTQSGTANSDFKDDPAYQTVSTRDNLGGEACGAVK